MAAQSKLRVDIVIVVSHTGAARPLPRLWRGEQAFFARNSALTNLVRDYDAKQAGRVCARVLAEDAESAESDGEAWTPDDSDTKAPSPFDTEPV
jgi:hypothetical protein